MALPFILQIFFRGGQDGLTFCAPAADPLYQSTRGALAIPRNASGNIGNYFTLPPAMQVLKPLFQAGKLAFVHGAGLPFSMLNLPKDRSHFNTQHKHETAGIVSNLATGWLARSMDKFSPRDPLNALRGLGHSNLLPRVLVGAPATIATADPINYDLPTLPPSLDLQKTALTGMYDVSEEPLKGAAASALVAIERLNMVTFNGGGATDFERAMQNIGDIMLDPDLLADDKRLVAFNVDLGGWDLHANLGPLDGAMHGLMTMLANQLVAFHNRFAFVGAPEYVLLGVTEFGRRFAPSASAGLDHGWGSVITVMGNQGVNGNKVYHSGWNSFPPHAQPIPLPPPELAPMIDADGDLRVTIDYRQVLAEALVDRFGVPPVEIPSIFPGLTYAPIGVFA